MPDNRVLVDSAFSQAFGRTSTGMLVTIYFSLHKKQSICTWRCPSEVFVSFNLAPSQRFKPHYPHPRIFVRLAIIDTPVLDSVSKVVFCMLVSKMGKIVECVGAP
jgi:hypothetical protein